MLPPSIKSAQYNHSHLLLWLWAMNSWTRPLIFSLIVCHSIPVNKNETYFLYTALMDMSVLDTFSERLLEIFHNLYRASMFSCSTGGSASLSICHPLSPSTHFCLVSRSLQWPPAPSWPSNPPEHLASGPMGAGHRVKVQANIRKHH